VGAAHLTYEAEGWGVGELWLEDDRPVWHELPRPGLRPRPGPYGHQLVERLQRYFAGEAVELTDVELGVEGASDFQQELLAALRRVPRGEVVSYGDLALLAGRPGAARAAGTFCARNPLPIFVPCHRVVAAAGLGGFGSLGEGYKRRLLALEGYRSVAR
jgi:methylated-DNA-[protein]-cysteine S-methyltransferase